MKPGTPGAPTPRGLAASLAALIVLLGPSAGWCDRPLPFYDQKDLTPFWPEDAKGKDVSASVLDSFRVIDQNGKSITEKNFAGKISLVNFFFARCGSVCPRMMDTIRKLQNQLKRTDEGRAVRIYSFSTLPKEDSPEALRAYALARKLDLSDWSLLTGSTPEIYRLGKNVFKADGSVGGQRNDSSFIHTSNLYVVDANLRIRGIYDTENAGQMALLAHDLRKLENEHF